LRIVIALIVIIVLGGILTAYYLVSPTQTSPAQLKEIQSTCASCHNTPQFSSESQAHDNHRFLECTVCHSNVSGEEVEEVHISFNPSICARCHTIPNYSNATKLHDAHSAADCSICHIGSNSLKSATSVHSAIRMAGLSMIVLAVVGFLVNFIVAKARQKE
jgi:disulfide bond formation protein DsbB